MDVSPSSRNYGRVIEKILEFGKELSSMGQQLEKENLMTEEERQMLEVPHNNYKLTIYVCLLKFILSVNRMHLA